ncbi:MAG: radical SAM protein [Candidatus Omnitrophica bacterium]|nr:radical SAM protein [Candidatus Omnitrophota bacterium]MDD5487981.1 radical SAM protein [Candidatus Omnitrophota bacterium]
MNRRNGERGKCGAGMRARVYTYMAHYGEEPPVSGSHGSGTIFFSGCNMSCVYCQNYKFSQAAMGRELSAQELADVMLNLQDKGCHNINLVSPTPYVPQILEALIPAIDRGLSVPIVYNTGGYDLVDVLSDLEGIVDIYLPDMRYADNEWALKFSGIPDYVENNRAVVREMIRQVGTRPVFSGDIMTKGLIVRLLMLPNGISGTDLTLDFLESQVGTDLYLSLMSQYYPAYRADGMPEVSRKIKKSEYDAVLRKMSECGFHNGWIQPFGEFETRFAGENFEPV